MSILVEGGQVRSRAIRTVQAPPAHPARPVRVRRAETLRPPSRAHVVAGRRPAVALCPAPRKLPVRWPWLAGLAVAICLGITGLGLLSQGVSGAQVPERTATVSVAPGETLSELAARFAPESDTDAVVARIKELNGLQDAVLVPGLPLTVPVAASVQADAR
ncbi:LysM peptidoglycan-binding domain-containing protein [Amycolatopsis sp. H20-H5]|uniref:LysM peptidoglycan-binding domain-containing protein n=1 Tax=Amycolatopsis sp. H20-H5 TaxID=3046309 RepID=UPI002DBA6F7B|nr:LysM peptidoglycan-binding domain-containing protein [Amycolatopsis sp. H20-H5]MEC3973983.1 LysM peptidoglycan-binding domain-containing protein [Amycolatopsis sp. H20-H5]